MLAAVINQCSLSSPGAVAAERCSPSLPLPPTFHGRRAPIFLQISSRACHSRSQAIACTSKTSKPLSDHSEWPRRGGSRPPRTCRGRWLSPGRGPKLTRLAAGGPPGGPTLPPEPPGEWLIDGYLRAIGQRSIVLLLPRADER